MKLLFASTIFLMLAGCGNDDAVVQQGAGEAQAPTALVDPARLETALRGFVDRGELVGVSALVYEDGKEAFFGAYGMADREAERRMQRDTLVRIFSMTKPITGVVLMTFYEEGLFDLDDPLAKHLPEYADIEVYAGEAEGQVRLETPARPPTIRDILRHTAGFANGDDGDRSWVDHRYREVEPGNIENTLEQMSVKLASVPLLFEPGTRWYYGPSVDVQARLVEVLGGKPYEVVLRERVLEPLRMHDTQYTLREDQRERISALYERQPLTRRRPARTRRVCRTDAGPAGFAHHLGGAQDESGDLERSVECRSDPGIASIDVTIKVNDAVRRHVSRPVKQQDRQRPGQEYRPHPLVRDSGVDSRAVPTIRSEQDFGEFQWILDPDAAMAESTFGRAEQLSRGRVVQIDCLFVREGEFDLPQSVIRSWPLHEKVVETSWCYRRPVDV